MSRPDSVEPFLRGAAHPAAPGVPYPRARPDLPMLRLPVDTWTMAQIPAGVRLEFTGGATAVEVDYECAHESFGYLGGGEGDCFVTWRGDQRVAEAPAAVGSHTIELPVGDGPDRGIIYLPERMGPTVTALRAEDGTIEPAPPQPRWLCYGDSIAEGWVVTTPDRAWPMIAGRAHGLDAVNLGYAGSARGEIPSAEEIADLDADIISISHGTNCWTRTPHSADLFAAGLDAFLAIVRQGHPETPVVAISPITRPDGEATENRLGATLADLRAAFEATISARIDGGDAHLTLVAGLPIVAPEQLADDIHPGDDGHQAMADTIGPALASALAGT